MPGARAALVAAAALAWTQTAPAAGHAWGETLERISSGVVSLDVDVTRAFDTERNQSSQATGFVVDAQQGLILTNRHVVTPGPVRAQALFLNQEEVPLVPVYRDPVHDFGFFRYDPEALRFIEPAELQLAPQGAQVGVAVRIVGNDAGEQLSILSGTIARLNRRAPDYGYGNYNDFNTFYIQAATGSSGGSSGSPVIDAAGRVVALNAGASASAASSFFLPLDRVERALRLISAGEPVTRGTLQTQFVQVAYDELRRLGLQPASESDYRALFPDQVGLLVVRNVLPEGVADGRLQVGDILLKLNGNPVADFVALESVLDDAVGDTVELLLERNGEPVLQPIDVADLHAITPGEYIKFGNAVVHELSYQQAWHLNKPQRGIYVAAPGYALATAGIPNYSVIEAIDGRAVDTLDDLEAILDGLADGQRAAVRYFTLDEAANTQQAIMYMDRRWYPAMRCSRDDAVGMWPCRALADGPEAARPVPVTVPPPPAEKGVVANVARSLVLINFDMPYSYSGVSDRHYHGTGVIVDAQRGLVVVDRNTVPEALGDVRLTFAASADIPGRVEFVHPLHNLAVVSYEPALLGDTDLRSAQLLTDEVSSGDQLRAIGLRSDGSVVSQSVQVASLGPLMLPLSNSLRFRDSNLEAIALETSPLTPDGVLVDKRGRVLSLWSSFAFDVGNETRESSRGMPAELVAETLELARSGRPLRSLEAELVTVPLSTARNLGLPETQAQALLQHDAGRRQVLSVSRTVAGSPAESLLRSGDLLLAVDGATVNRFREVERAVFDRESVTLTVWRDGDAVVVDVPTAALETRGVRRLLYWSGVALQEPYRDIAAQRGIEPDGVYVAYFAYGTPASRAGLGAGSRIVAVDGEAVHNLDDFIRLTANKADGESVRLTTREWNDAVSVITLRIDETYWPAWEVVYNGDWHRVTPGAAHTRD